MSRRAGALWVLLAGLPPVLGWADDPVGMASGEAAPFGAPVGDERIYMHALLDQFEYRAGDGASLSRWDGEAWVGTDSSRLLIRSEGEVAPHGQVTDGQHEALYDRPITSFFDLQAGVRADLDSAAGRTWAALGIAGLAPQFVQVAATAYASDGGHFAVKLHASYDELLTQRWILQPELEVNAYSHNDPARRIGSGVADLDAGLRLRYEIRRKFAPYFGVGYERTFAGTARYVRAAGQPVGALRILLGVRAWL